MASVPGDLRYTKDHEWVKVVDASAKRARVGITDHAQRQLGDVVFAEIPRPGDRFESAEPFGSIESVKAVSEVFMPVSGTIAAVNDQINDGPEIVNDDPYGEGWLIEVTMSAPAELDDLLDAAGYEAYCSDAD